MVYTQEFIKKEEAENFNFEIMNHFEIYSKLHARNGY